MACFWPSECGVKGFVGGCEVHPHPCFQELIDASVALDLRELLKHVANLVLNDYDHVSWLRLL
ncbi:hypothetical protein DRO64_06760 [Candidatus Bathyarchaeota archaeon]|nr:MAG: hypothetical protein DRO64_06760 [Candidatus Bathyarchaeota archaeon]